MTCAGVWPSWLSGALVGGTVVYLGILFREYAIWLRRPTTHSQRYGK